MLSFSEPFVQNEEANALIEKNVNLLLLDMMDDVIDALQILINVTHLVIEPSQCSGLIRCVFYVVPCWT